jgi:heptosyltransferase I
MRVLIVKMSSLGDVVHTLPALSDAATARPGEVEFDWVVEEAFAPIAARHPAVRRVIPVAWRRWRRDLRGHWPALQDGFRRLRESRYDRVIDAQGLIKSAVVAVLARGPTVGFSRRSAREGVAALAYRRQLPIDRNVHAVERLRRLFAAALDYPVPTSPAEFGIAAAQGDGQPRDRPRLCVLLHGTTWASKHWPLAFWRHTARRAAAAGFDVVVPWGGPEEQPRARAIVDGTPARLLDRQPLDTLLETLSRADLAVGVDSGLSHLAAALGVPTVVVYGSTDSALTGARGRRVVNLSAHFPCAPCLGRACRYRGPAQTWQHELIEPACYVSVPPPRVWEAATELLERHG